MVAIPERLPRITRADNDLLLDEDGRRYIDLFSGNGAVSLGHGNREITAALVEQAKNVWLTGTLPTPIREAATTAVENFFPTTHALAGLYSTGMEAVEFALRYARVVTGRNGTVGFARSMHGKSLAAAFLGWDNQDGLELPGFRRLPFLPDCSEEEILTRLRDVLTREAISAVFVEPIQGSGGGHRASAAFHREVRRLCAAAGVLLIFDEILTGFYRTGGPFYFSELGFVPDVILIGKGMANGFPASAVVARRDGPVCPRMLPGSTFAGNPLAAAAVVSTLRQMLLLNLPERVAGIERLVTADLASLTEAGMPLRGQGALWVLETPPEMDVEAAVVRIYERGVCVGHAGGLIRLLPPLTIEPENLRAACAVVQEECARGLYGRD